MRQTLFSIPHEIGGIPVFGIGLLLAIWIVFSIGLIAWLIRRHGFDAETRSYIPVLVIVAAAILLLLPMLEDAESGLPIRGYGVMMLCGVVAGVGLSAWRASLAGIEADTIFSLAFWMFVAGILGARLFHVIEYWEANYRRTSDDGAIDLAETFKTVINVPQGGLVVYGSLIGGTIALIWFVRRKKLPGLAVCDLIAPGMILGLALGRIGCLMNGCCFGGQCELPWAITFPRESLPYQRQVERGLDFALQIDGQPAKLTQVPAGSNFEKKGLRAGDEAKLPVIAWIDPALEGQGLQVGDRVVRFGALQDPLAEDIWSAFREHAYARGEDKDRAKVDDAFVSIVTDRNAAIIRLTSTAPRPRSLPIQPTQIYSAINAALICLFLLAYYPHRGRDGEVFALLITIYPITRFLLEIIRTDEADMFGTRLSISQIVSVLLLLGVVAFWAYVMRQPNGQPWKPRRA